MRSVIVIVGLILFNLASTGPAGASGELQAPVGSDNPLSEEQPFVELVSLIETAFYGNPGIAAARAEWEASAEIYPQAKALPDPKLTFKWMPEPIETRNGSTDWGIEFMQMIPNPRRLSLLGDKALTLTEMARIKYEKKVRDVLTDVMASYFELGYISEAMGISETNRDIFAQISDLANLRYSQNEIPLAEWNTAISRLAQAEYELLLLQEIFLSEQSWLNSLLGRPPDTPVDRIGLPGVIPIEFELEDLRSRVLEYRQELKMAGISVELAEFSLSIERSKNAPDYSIGFMYNSIGVSPMSDGMGTSGEDAYGVMFGITIPLWGGKNRARVNEAKADLEAAELKYEDAQARAIADADRSFYDLANKARLSDLYQGTLLPEAIQSADLAQTWYDEGQISLSGLIESRLVAENFLLASARAKADYLIALTSLQKLTGAPMIDWLDITEVEVSE